MSDSMKAARALTDFSSKLWQVKGEVGKEQIPKELQPIAGKIQEIVNDRSLSNPQKQKALGNIKAQVLQHKGSLSSDIFKQTIPSPAKGATQVDQEIRARMQRDVVEEGAYINELDEMSPEALTAHVQGLSTTGSPSGIEYLFSQEVKNSNRTRGASQREMIGQRLAKEFSALTPEQAASLKENEALWNLIEQYPQVAGKALSPQSLAILSGNHKKQETLKGVIDKMPQDDHLLPKLQAIAPNTLDGLDLVFGVKAQSLTTFDWKYEGLTTTKEEKQQFAKELQDTVKGAKAKRAEQKAAEYEKMKAKRETADAAPSQAAPSQPKKTWTVGGAKPPPAAETQKGVEKRQWSSEELQDFKEGAFGSYPNSGLDAVLEKFHQMDDQTIKNFVKGLDDKQLDKLWNIEAKTINAKSWQDMRKDRLGSIFENLSSSQFREAVQNPKFREIMGNTTDGYASIAAEKIPANTLKELLNVSDSSGNLDKDLVFALKSMASKMDRETPELPDKLKVLAQVKSRDRAGHAELKANIEKKLMSVPRADRTEISNALKGR